ncbi:MAG: undecaprenyldiphospho-muramoylpentapeptide beta-N-acetylglucosaminyltransferase [Spirochaetota bacterium]
MIAITGGGTGGHIFPNIAVIEALRDRGGGRVFWIGKKRSSEEKEAENAGVAFYGIRAGKLRRYFSVKNIFDVFNIIAGFLQSLIILGRLKPQVLFSKGGFVSVPPAAAARMLGIPVITHESDIIPGLANRIISRTASLVCVSFEKTAQYFPGKRVEITGNPVRAVVERGNRQKGLEFLGFDETTPVVLVIGGSLGAAFLNRIVREMVSGNDVPFRVAHQCGRGNIDTELLGRRGYRQFEFIFREIGDVLAAADIVVSRAGAGAIFEICCCGRPSVLIPLPREQSRGEQIQNAAFVKEKGAAVVVQEHSIDGRRLLEILTVLLADRKKLAEMGKNASSLYRHRAHEKIAELILNELKYKK